MKKDRIPLAIMEAAHETWRLEHALGEDEKAALEASVRAALNAYQQQAMEEVAELATTLAQELDCAAEDTEEALMSEDGPAALLWLAKKLQEQLPPEGLGEYAPTTDDLVEVLLVGTVIREQDGNWSVIAADFDGAFEFDVASSRALQVRLIHRTATEI